MAEIVLCIDTILETKNKSVKGNKYCHFFASNNGHINTHAMKSQDEFEIGLHWSYKEVGIPVGLILDGFSAQTKSSVKTICDQVNTTFKMLERANRWENIAELCVGLLNEAVRKDMRE